MRYASILVLSLAFIPACTPAQEDEVKQIKKIAEINASAHNNILKKNYSQAEKKFTALAKLKPDDPTAYYYRGRVRFQQGKIKQSIEDFDRYIELRPKVKNSQWERGIALYYAGQFAKGAEQFRIYQSYHDNDVENSAWRFLCMAQSEGIEAARKNLLTIKSDRRIPMMQIYQMYQGKMTPAEVLKAAEELPENESQKNSARFYANLYVGLLHEVRGDQKLAKKHIEIAERHPINHYMWDVASVHLKLRQGTKQPDASK